MENRCIQGINRLQKMYNTFSSFISKFIQL